MGGHERERIVRRHLDVQFRKTAADAETVSAQKKIFIGMRAASREGKFAEDGDMDVGIIAAHMFPIG